jgi:glycosyltransferase involved in cell wall biosynthesis
VKIAFLTGPRAAQPMGMELAEQRLLDALRLLPLEIDHRVVGGRAARVSAGAAHARWIPSHGGLTPAYAARGTDLVHLAGLELRPPRRGKFIVTVHDLAPLRFRDEGELPPWARESVERAELVLCPSRFAASEIHALLEVPETRLRVIGGGVGLDAEHAEPLGDAELEALGITRPFVLRCGGYSTRKNVRLLLDAWRDVEAPGALVLAGPPHASRDELRELADDRVVWLDYAPAELLVRLFRSASALVSTSTYEGFGMPVLEALAAGTPVIALRTAFTEEICGDAALLVEPDELAGALSRVLTDGDVRDTLRLAGPARAAAHTWPAAAGRVADAYRSVL